MPPLHQDIVLPRQLFPLSLLLLHAVGVRQGMAVEEGFAGECDRPSWTADFTCPAGRGRLRSH